MSYKDTDIIMYRSEDGTIKIDVRMEDETVWLSQAQMVDLFQSSKANISEHIKNIFAEGELREDLVVRNFRTTAADGKNYNVKHYNLDVIISVGYRVKSLRGTQFRIWATERLREYLIKGFTMNDDLLKKAGGGNYWKELLERIRDIRSSEKVFYRQLLDLFATSIDYDPKSEECRQFFQIVQNKLHYAVNKQTSAEIIHSRANAELPFMGMKTFSGEQPNKEEAMIAKNYLDEKELSVLNRMVSAFFDLAELHAMNHEPMYMRDWLPQVDDFAERYGKGILESAGTVSRQTAIEKAADEYKKYRKRISDLPSPVERDYLETIKQTQKKLKGKTGGERE
ncbi:MAG: cell filamentation protein Fic [Firmicutes bacterium HGW-Firmicutes-12]|nr:MAG: cell filamentation protein Fic [Firmicutes bacterium HGW-Firmicutes-12]